MQMKWLSDANVQLASQGISTASFAHVICELRPHMTLRYAYTSHLYVAMIGRACCDREGLDCGLLAFIWIAAIHDDGRY